MALQLAALACAMPLAAARAASAAEPEPDSDPAWTEYARILVDNQAQAETPRLNILFDSPFDREASARAEQALRKAVATGDRRARLTWALLQVGLTRLASQDLPVMLTPIESEVGHYPQPAGPAGTRLALAWLRGIVADPQATVDQQATARIGLAHLYALLGPDIQEPDRPPYAQQLDEVLRGQPEATLQAAVLLVTAGRCEEARPRLQALAQAPGGADDPALAPLQAACSGFRPVLPKGCVDYDAGSTPIAQMPPIRALDFGDMHAAWARVFNAADVAACVWRRIAEAPAGAADPARQGERVGVALRYVGWPKTPADRVFMTRTGDALVGAQRASEALPLLERGSPKGRLEAARILLAGQGVPADPAAARALLARSQPLAREDAEWATALARLRFEGSGGPVDRVAALRDLAPRQEASAQAEYRRLLDSLPWRYAVATVGGGADAGFGVGAAGASGAAQAAGVSKDPGTSAAAGVDPGPAAGARAGTGKGAEDRDVVAGAGKSEDVSAPSVSTPDPASRGKIAAPPWLDLAALQWQVYGADASTTSVSSASSTASGERGAWLQRLENLSSSDLAVLHSPQGTPRLLRLTGPQADGKYQVVSIASWPDDAFARTACVTPDDAGGKPASRGQGGGQAPWITDAPPVGVRLSRQGPALALERVTDSDAGVLHDRIFVSVEDGVLRPLLCVRYQIDRPEWIMMKMPPEDDGDDAASGDTTGSDAAASDSATGEGTSDKDASDKNAADKNAADKNAAGNNSAGNAAPGQATADPEANLQPQLIFTPDRWRVTITQDFHDDHADVLLSHEDQPDAPRPGRELLLRWNGALGRYLALSRPAAGTPPGRR
ncbi:hypothetical protein CAL29_17085 [Bordetella genomosp. 10]|uniref:Uncharacterized protein n=2 Tax=Bordetella genomosp. 10 TaxID=1416804 RepID=A0A261RYR7_9BORD|nr:hypothetical protein CAL29_17085 [Bordetella genomosp. 10]